MGVKERFYVNVTALHSEVTGSCITMNVEYPDGRTTNFIVDCGLFQEAEYNQLNCEKLPFDCQNIEFALITHNHADHMGRLPMLMKGGFEGKIYATKATTHLMKPALEDTFQIMKNDSKLLKKKALYGYEDVEKVYSQLVACELETTVYVNRNIKITYLDNGHIIGAGMILVQISYPNKEDINLLFTGDYKPNNIFKEVRDIPEWVRKLPITIVIESTYGHMLTKDIKYHLEDDIERVLKEGKSLLISVFAQGRAQEILYRLKEMQKDGRISKKIPIYLDGKLSHKYTYMYLNYDLGISEDKRAFLPENFKMIDKDSRKAVLNSETQQIILTTSGMMDNGPAQIYVPEFIEKNNYVLYIPGYASEGTLGWRLINSKDGKVTIAGKECKINAEVLVTSECSSHGKADELETLLRMFENLELVLINHGETETQHTFKAKLEEDGIAKRVEILSGYNVRVSHYGFLKTMGAKLYNMAEITAKAKKERRKNKAKKPLKYIKRRKCV